MTIDTAKLLSILSSVMPLGKDSVALHEPLFIGNEVEYVTECIQSGWVSSVGSYVNLFERMICEYTGAKHAIAVVNGTAALHVCLSLAGVCEGDEVLIPTLSFIATANAVAYCGAVPHFIDSQEQDLGIHVNKLREYLQNIAVNRDGHCYNKLTGRRIGALVAMHTFGHPVDLDPLLEVCKLYSIPLVEDAAESLGSFYKGKHTGNWGIASAFSFNGNKIITTGGGGAVITNDDALAKKAKHLTTTAKLPHRWEYVHDEIGFNYRLPNINAALGCAQMETIGYYISRKRALAESYSIKFDQFQGAVFLKEQSYAQSNYWLNAIILEKVFADSRDLILQVTNDIGIMTRPVWRLLHKLTMYTTCPKMDLEYAESLEQRIINIPSSANLRIEF